MTDHDFDEGAGSRKADSAKRRQGISAPVPGLTDVAGLMDSLSLEQALKDAEIANARVVDLTQRLVAAQRQTVELQSSMADLEVKFADQRARYQRVVGSHAYRMAHRYWRVLGALRGVE